VKAKRTVSPTAVVDRGAYRSEVQGVLDQIRAMAVGDDVSTQDLIEDSSRHWQLPTLDTLRNGVETCAGTPEMGTNVASRSMLPSFAPPPLDMSVSLRRSPSRPLLQKAVSQSSLLSQGSAETMQVLMSPISSVWRPDESSPTRLTKARRGPVALDSLQPIYVPTSPGKSLSVAASVGSLRSSK
jgi:hypothetical protein